MRRESFSEGDVEGRREYRYPFFRIWDPLLAGVAGVFALIGIDVLVSFHWQPRAVAIENGEAFYYPWSPVWMVAGAGVVSILIGYFVGMDRQFHNWICIALGVGLLTLGTSYVAMERVTVTDDGFSARRWWGFQSRSWRFDDLQSVTIITHQRSKGARWQTVRWKPKGPEDQTGSEEVGVPRLMSECFLVLREHAAPKGVGVTITSASR